MKEKTNFHNRLWQVERNDFSMYIDGVWPCGAVFRVIEGARFEENSCTDEEEKVKARMRKEGEGTKAEWKRGKEIDIVIKKEAEGIMGGAGRWRRKTS